MRNMGLSIPRALRIPPDPQRPRRSRTSLDHHPKEALTTTKLREIEAERALAAHMNFGASHLLTNAIKYPKFLSLAQHPDFQRRSFLTRQEFCDHREWKERGRKRDVSTLLPQSHEEYKVFRVHPPLTFVPAVLPLLCSPCCDALRGLQSIREMSQREMRNSLLLKDDTWERLETLKRRAWGGR